MRNPVILSSGSYAPENIIPNEYFNKLLGEDVDTWLRENLTIKERRWCKPGQSTIDLCEAAAVDAINRAGINAADLDLIIISTDTPEFISPSTSSVLQHRIGAIKAGTFDINTACAGFVTALDTAGKFIKADDNYNLVLVIGAYAMSKYLNLADKKTVTLFADGAGAVVLGVTDEPGRGWLAGSLYTEGQYAGWMGIYAGGTRTPMNPAVLAAGDHLLKFIRKFPKEINPETWTRMITKSCATVNLLPTDIQHYFFTQININSIWETLENLNVPREKAHTIMDKYGYTGSACIPMALDSAFKQGKINKGDLMCFMGSGGGLAFANAIYRY